MDEEQDSGSDLELEEDWEAVPTVGTHTEAQDGGVDGVNVLGRWNGTGSCPGASITISLTDEALKDEADGGTAATTAKPHRRGRVYSGAERAAAADVHRAHALCLLGRALLLDAAASDEALQAELLSLLPPQLAADAASAAAADAPTADSWLPALLRWFHRRFTTLPLVDAATTSKRALRRQLIAEQQQQQQHLGGSNGEQHLVMMAQMRTCMDTQRGTAEQLAALLAATLRAAGFLTRSVWCLDALPLRPAAVEALARGQTIRSKPPAAAGSNHGGGNHGGGGAAAAAGGRGGGSGHSSGRGVRDASEQKQQQQPAAKKQRGRSRARRGAASTADSTDNNDYDNGGDTKTASLRKGDAEFEAQLAMALASTAAEAEGRAAAAATAACTMTSQGGMMGRSGSSRRSPLPSLNPQLPPRGGGSGGSRSLPALIERGASAAALRAAAAPPPGFLWRPNDAAVAPTSWCEVYVGSSAHGRWLHVDGLLGCWDHPSVVEASTARRQPVSYIVACQGGAPKDVTRRYAANLPFTLRWRDEAWWSSTMTALRSSSIAHLPRSVAVQYHVPPSRHGIVAQAAGAAAAAAAQLHQHAAESHKTGEDDAAAGGGQASFVVQQQQHIISGGGSGGGGNGSDPPTTTTTTTTTAAGGAALLRAVREEQELAATAARQTAAPPSSVEGFKDHPLYVLTRHIGQRQALVPGAAKLGLHKGEAYYARAAVQDCAPRLAWRRQGRDVRVSELAAPAKRIKKRRRTPSSTTTATNTTSMRGGWGGWQRSSPVASAPEADEEAGGADEQLQQLLYGLWQTEPWSPPPAVGGIVPRNEHGNVEVPPLTCALPAGTVHIPLPGLLPVCRMLRIDAAPALVGFEVQAGRNLPKMLGVVVCLEHEQAVLEAYWARERDRAVEAETAAVEEAAAAWRRLLGHLWTRLRLQRAYGDGDGGRDRETADQGLAKQNSGGGTTAAAVVARLTCPSPTCVAATHSTVPGMQQKSIVPVDQPASVTAAAGVGATAASPQSHPHGEMMMQTNDAHLQHADGAVVDVEEF